MKEENLSTSVESTQSWTDGSRLSLKKLGEMQNRQSGKLLMLQDRGSL